LPLGKHEYSSELVARTKYSASRYLPPPKKKKKERQKKGDEKGTFTTEAKLSSKIMISELSFATSVPEMPMERPISA